MFRDLNLIPSILSAVESEGYASPTPVQAASIPSILEHRDLLGCAQTGTGKTAAFALPILQNLNAARPANGRPIRALVLTPTRELALQIAENFAAYGKNLDLRMAVIFGGVGDGPQKAKLRAGVDILVATPGRLIDLLGQRALTLSNLEIFTLDEADRMLDMGFVHDVRRICALLPAKRQTLLFSATMPNEIRKLADGLLRNPVKVEVTPVSSTVEKIEQSIYMVGKEGKPALLRHILADEAVKRVLVFTRTKHGADRLKRSLEQYSIPAEAIHGNKSQNHRVRSLASFKDGSTRVLVATDLASRGIDVDEITHIVNYDLPAEPETYVHRIGRTARAGHSGISFSFCGPEDRGTLHDIERLIRKRIQVVPTPHESEMRTPAPMAMPERYADESGDSDRGRGEGSRNPRGQRRGRSQESRGGERRDSGHRRASTGHNQGSRVPVSEGASRGGFAPAGSQPVHARENRSGGQPRDSRPAHMRGNGNAQGGQDSQGGRGPSKRRNSQGQGKAYVREYYSNGR
ncbi:MAG TPA: DEAD/DEAH box helicase [Fibrobacteria bacterium]|nr:DEAD/DEAH box helicase [Fibrobacteria bacterium]